MRRVTPEEFNRGFLDVAEQEAEAFNNVWNSDWAAVYTPFMLRHFLPRVATRLGLLHHPEYFRLDAILYEERDTRHFTKMFVRSIAAVIEHENSAGTSCEEMNKLQRFNVPLKVLIAYARDGKELETLLVSYDDIIRAADHFQDTATLRRQLVIFGDPVVVNRWRSFVFEAPGFRLLADVTVRRSAEFTDPSR
jgi:hypothetical protein